MKKIEAVLFDCDGVVVDSAELQVLAEQLIADDFSESQDLEFNIDDHDWAKMQGWGRANIAQEIFRVDHDSELALKYRAEVVDKTVEIASETNLSLVHEVSKFIGFLLRRNITPALVTSSHRKIFTKYGEVLELGSFAPDYVVCQGESGEDKPKPGPYLEVLRRLNLDASKSIVVEDTRSGITSGRNAGSTVLGLATTKSPEYLRSQTAAHKVVESYRQATAWIESLIR